MGEYVLQSKPWRWIALFLPIAIGMFTLDRCIKSVIRRPANICWIQLFAGLICLIYGC